MSSDLEVKVEVINPEKPKSRKSDIRNYRPVAEPIPSDEELVHLPRHELERWARFGTHARSAARQASRKRYKEKGAEIKIQKKIKSYQAKIGENRKKEIETLRELALIRRTSKVAQKNNDFIDSLTAEEVNIMLDDLQD